MEFKENINMFWSFKVSFDNCFIFFLFLKIELINIILFVIYFVLSNPTWFLNLMIKKKKMGLNKHIFHKKTKKKNQWLLNKSWKNNLLNLKFSWTISSRCSS